MRASPVSRRWNPWLVRVLFEPARFPDYLRHYVVFEEDDRTGRILKKKVAGYHQFRAMDKTRAAAKAALKSLAGEGDGRGGVIWPT